MAKQFLTPIDLAKNELQNARVHNLAAAPGSPVAGQIYYDTVSLSEYFWNGSGWIPTDATKRTGIPLANLASDPLARDAHTGTQLAATISDFNTAVRLNRLDQLAAPTAAVSMNSQKITSLAAPTAASDAANKQYVDDTVAAISWKQEVRVATTTNGTLATAFTSSSTVDTVSLNLGDRILIKDQTNQTENGIYTVTAGAPVRALDADSEDDIKGAAVYVSNGVANSGTRWVCNNTYLITLGTTNITFVQFAGGTTYTAGNGLTLNTNDFNVGAGTGITVNANDVAVDTTVVVRKFAANVGDGSALFYVVTHSLGTLDVTVGVYRNSGSFDEILCDVEHTSTNTTTVRFASAPASNAFSVVIHG